MLSRNTFEKGDKLVEMGEKQMDIRASIEDTRKGFEESFASEDFYNRQTQDAEHLERILAGLKRRKDSPFFICR